MHRLTCLVFVINRLPVQKVAAKSRPKLEAKADLGSWIVARILIWSNALGDDIKRRKKHCRARMRGQIRELDPFHKLRILFGSLLAKMRAEVDRGGHARVALEPLTFGRALVGLQLVAIGERGVATAFVDAKQLATNVQERFQLRDCVGGVVVQDHPKEFAR